MPWSAILGETKRVQTYKPSQPTYLGYDIKIDFNYFVVFFLDCLWYLQTDFLPHPQTSGRPQLCRSCRGVTTSGFCRGKPGRCRCGYSRRRLFWWPVHSVQDHQLLLWSLPSNRQSADQPKKPRRRCSSSQGKRSSNRRFKSASSGIETGRRGHPGGYVGGRGTCGRACRVNGRRHRSTSTANFRTESGKNQTIILKGLTRLLINANGT